MIFRNKHYDGSDNTPCTRIVACEVLETGRVPEGEQWVSATSYILTGLTPLWIQAGIRYWGHL